MKSSKLVIRVILLGFIAAAIGYMFLRDRTSAQSQAAAKTATKTATAPAPDGSGFVAYYFHGTRRCRTCKAIEAQAKEAVTSKFAEELRQGRLRWTAVNLEELGNEHFAADYGVTGSTLVLAELKGGRPVRFAKLEQTWRFVNNKPAFLDYVSSEVTAFLRARR